MDEEVMNLEQVASILHRDVREVTKMADRGHLPGQKVGGQWRFASAEINYWIEQKMSDFTEQQLTNLETGASKGNIDRSPLVTTLLSEDTMAVPLQASTRTSILRELVKVAEQSWQVWDPEALLNAVKAREDMTSTAFASGVAFPHPRRPQPGILGESVIAYGRTLNGVPFGGGAGVCDLFFLVCCQDYATHLRVLARLSRMMLHPGVVESLRESDSVGESFEILQRAEEEMMRQVDS